MKNRYSLLLKFRFKLKFKSVSVAWMLHCDQTSDNEHQHNT